MHDALKAKCTCKCRMQDRSLGHLFLLSSLFQYIQHIDFKVDASPMRCPFSFLSDNLSPKRFPSTPATISIQIEDGSHRTVRKRESLTHIQRSIAWCVFQCPV